MDIRQFLSFIRRRAWIVVVITLVFGGVAYALASRSTPIYRATATMLVNQTQTPGAIQYNDILTSQHLTNTYAYLVQSRPILDSVAGRVGSDPDTLGSKVSVSAIRDTQLLRISVEDPSPQQAARIANAVAQVFIEDNESKTGTRSGTVSISEPAVVPGAPVKPNVKLNTAMALVLGFMFAAAIALLLEYLDDTIKSAKDVQEAAALPTLGLVPRLRSGRRKDGEPGLAMTHEIEEDYRQIRTNIHFAMLGGPSKCILVTSANPQEGKSTTVAHLGSILAQAGHTVILVDSDMRRPSLHEIFQTQNSFGLTGLILSETEDIDAALIPVAENLLLLPSGPVPANPSEILMSQQAETLFAGLRARADYLILDSPPVLAVTDAQILAGMSDAAIIVIQPGKIRADALATIADTLRQTRSRVMGVIINKAKRTGHRNYGQYRQKPAGTAEVVPMSAARETRETRKTQAVAKDR